MNINTLTWKQISELVDKSLSHNADIVVTFGRDQTKIRIDSYKPIQQLEFDDIQITEQPETEE